MDLGVAILAIVILVLVLTIVFASNISKLRKSKKYERSLKMVPLLIHLPPTTDDIDSGSKNLKNCLIIKSYSRFDQFTFSTLNGTFTLELLENEFKFILCDCRICIVSAENSCQFDEDERQRSEYNLKCTDNRCHCHGDLLRMTFSQ